MTGGRLGRRTLLRAVILVRAPLGRSGRSGVLSLEAMAGGGGAGAGVEIAVAAVRRANSMMVASLSCNATKWAKSLLISWLRRVSEWV